jgi:transcriptional regulator with XRE-family HTH domain
MWGCAPLSRHKAPVVKHADTSAEADQLLQQQSRRLLRFRIALGLSRQQAADMAGVARFTWRRMEMGTSRIDTVPLRRFLAAYERVSNLPAEYVISGNTSGLPPDLVRDLVRMEIEEGDHSTLPSAYSDDPPPNATANKPRRKRTAGSGSILDRRPRQAA